MDRLAEFTVIHTNSVYSSEKCKRKLKKDGTPKWSGGDRKSGKSSMVYPIKDPEKFREFHDYWLKKMEKAYTPYKKFVCARNYLLVIIGCNSAYRISDIVTLKWKDLLQESTVIRKEQKTDKYRGVFFNSMINDAIEYFLKATSKSIDNLDMEDYVFVTCKSKSNSDKNSHMSEANALDFIKKMAKDIGIKENVGTHTLRKNFVYWTLITHKDDVNILYRVMELMNHSTPRMTFAYATITEEESKQLFVEVGETYRSILSGVYDSMRKNVVSISYDAIVEILEAAYSTGKKDANESKNIHDDNLTSLKEILDEYIL